jgi:thiamine-phosphate pyrophosphorylase
MPTVDLSLYVITDTPLSARHGLIETTLAAVRGGATLVQLRDPLAKAGWLVEMGRALVHALKPHHVPLIINDRPDVAYAVGAAGVHVGQGDLPPDAARAILGPNAIIGLSITHHDQLALVPWDLIDHIGVGPVLSKGVKPDAAEPMGLEGLRSCVALSRKPVVAIGGMTVAMTPEMLAAGAAGVAVVAAIAGADDPEMEAAAFAAVIRQHRSGGAGSRHNTAT